MEVGKKDWALHKQNLYWICQIGGWGAFFAFGMLTLQDQEALNVHTALDTLCTVTALLLATHFFRRFITRWEWLKLLFGQLFPRIIISSLALSAIVLPIQMGFTYIISGSFSADASAILRAIIEGSFLFFFWQVAYFLYHYVNNYNRNLKLEAMINEFELNKLKSQLNPHFIFNALNSVKALVDEDPDRAKDSIYQLSSILRSSLMMDKRKVITFEEELDIVQNYLALEGTRFEERLRTEFDIAPEALRYKVPPMMLQTLVENGIKHGISKYKDGGVIKLKAIVADNILHIQISNTGQLDPNHKPTTGYGISSTMQRLDLLYDKEAVFTIENEGEMTVVTKLQIPVWNVRELTVREQIEA